MTKEQIDQYFRLVQIGPNPEEIAELIEDVEYRRRFEIALLHEEISEEETEKQQQEFAENMLRQIQESALYEYFEEIGLKEENQSEFFEMILHSTIPVEVEKAKKYLKRLDSKEYILKIIKATKDVTFIKQCIEDEDLGFTLQEKCELVENSEDSEYIKNFIAQYEAQITIRDLVRLVCATKDIDLIKQYIERDKKRIKGYSMVALIQATESPEYIKQCSEDETFKFSFEQKAKLIIATQNFDYIRSFIEENKMQIGLSTNEEIKRSLIEATADADYIKKCIEDGAISCSMETRIYLIRKTNNPDAIKQFIIKYLRYLRSEDKIQLIKAVGESEYLKQCIYYNLFGLTEDEKLELMLMLVIQDKDFVLQCLNDEELCLSAPLKIVLAQVLGKSEIKLTLIKQCENENVETKIELPEGMTIGIEIESEGKFSNVFRGEFFEGWKNKGDASLKTGLEVVSPVLRGTSRDSQNINTICNILAGIGQETSERCGGHIHIGADYLTGTDSYINLLTLWGNSEKVLYEISNSPYELPRWGAIGYAGPISKKIEKALESGSISIEDSSELSDFITQLKNIQGERYSGINFLNISLQKKNTIEFRLPNGTIDPKTWIENINLFGGIVKAAEEIAQIQRKSETTRSEEEQKKIELFERISNGNKSEEEILDILLTLSVSSDKRWIYENRYAQNSKLMRADFSLEHQLEAQIAQKPIKPKKIGKKVFVDSEPTDGIQMQAAETRLNSNRMQMQELISGISNPTIV